MLAYRLMKSQSRPELLEAPEPHAGPGQVVLKAACSWPCLANSAHGGSMSVSATWNRRSSSMGRTQRSRMPRV